MSGMNELFEIFFLLCFLIIFLWLILFTKFIFSVNFTRRGRGIFIFDGTVFIRTKFGILCNFKITHIAKHFP